MCQEIKGLMIEGDGNGQAGRETGRKTDKHDDRLIDVQKKESRKLSDEYDDGQK